MFGLNKNSILHCSKGCCEFDKTIADTIVYWGGNGAV